MGDFFWPRNPKGGLIQPRPQYTGEQTLYGRLTGMLPQGQPLGAADRRRAPYPVQQQPSAPEQAMPTFNYQTSDRVLGALGNPSIRQRLMAKPPTGTPDYGQSQYLGAPGDRSTDEQSARTSSIRGLLNRPVTPVPQPQAMAASTAGRVTPPAPGGQLGTMPPAVTPLRQALTAGAPTGTRAAGGADQPSLLQAAMANRQPGGSPAVAQSTPPSALPNVYNTPYYRERAARQAVGQGAPYNGMAATGGASEPVSPLRKALQTFPVSTGGQQPSQNPAPGEVPPIVPTPNGGRPLGQGLKSLMNNAEYAKYTAAGGRKPLMSYSGSGQEQVTRGADGLIQKLRAPRNREEGLARTNRLGEGGMTFDQAVADRANFNKDGRFFQGAKLSEQNGRPVFVSDNKPPAFAGGQANEADAAASRLAGMLRMQQQGKGYVTPDNKFVGMAGKGGGEAGAANAALLRDNPNALAGRLAAGGTTPSALSPQQMEQNKSLMMSRLLAKRQQAQGIRTDRAQAVADARRNAPSPLVQAMMERNPELAAKLMAMQQHGQIAQKQFELDNARMNQDSQFKKDDLAARTKSREDELAFKKTDTVAERAAKVQGQKDAIAAADARQKNVNDFQAGEGKLNRQNARDVAGDLATRDDKRFASEERIRKDANDAALIKEVMAHPDMTLEEKKEYLANRQAQAAGPTVSGAPVATLPPPGQRISDKLKRSFAGGTLTEKQFTDAKAIEDPNHLRDKLASYGLTKDEQTIALNEIRPPSGIFGAFGLKTRSPDNPSGWSNYFSGKKFSGKTGKLLPPFSAQD